LQNGAGVFSQSIRKSTSRRSSRQEGDAFASAGDCRVMLYVREVLSQRRSRAWKRFDSLIAARFQMAIDAIGSWAKKAIFVPADLHIAGEARVLHF
jgi:hypothetical protein